MFVVWLFYIKFIIDMFPINQGLVMNFKVFTKMYKTVPF